MKSRVAQSTLNLHDLLRHDCAIALRAIYIYIKHERIDILDKIWICYDGCGERQFVVSKEMTID